MKYSISADQITNTWQKHCAAAAVEIVEVHVAYQPSKALGHVITLRFNKYSFTFNIMCNVHINMLHTQHHTGYRPVLSNWLNQATTGSLSPASKASPPPTTGTPQTSPPPAWPRACQPSPPPQSARPCPTGRAASSPGYH